MVAGSMFMILKTGGEESNNKQQKAAEKAGARGTAPFMCCVTQNSVIIHLCVARS